MGGRHNIFRDGTVHVMSEECKTCIFKPHARPVDGARVAGMVRDTMDEPGSSVVCHSTLYRGHRKHAICRGWYDRLGDRDPILLYAGELGIIKEQEPE